MVGKLFFVFKQELFLKAWNFSLTWESNDAEVVLVQIVMLVFKSWLQMDKDFKFFLTQLSASPGHLCKPFLLFHDLKLKKSPSFLRGLLL